MRVVIHDATRKQWLEFCSPAAVFCARGQDEVSPAIRRASAFAKEKNLPLAGFVSYEAACGIDPALPCGESDFPLVYFCAYEKCTPLELPAVQVRPEAVQWRSEMTRENYSRNFERIKQYIADGETYQVNYTFRMRSDSFNAACAWEYWLAMMNAQRCEYGAFMETPEWTICSASPELFFSAANGAVRCRPMKGTAARGLWPAADELAAAELANSEKNRAENLMIVDMMRNDMGRFARAGSVEAAELCVVEKYPTLWQMVSEIGCRCDCDWVDVMMAMFPCASITGAPKRRTMQIICELETSPRKIYTGAVGFVLPGGLSQFSVAIRTVLVDKISGAAEYGVGGGVVWDSSDAGEYDESLLKAKVVLEPAPRPVLLETLLWENGEYFLLERHMDRLSASAGYFDYAFDRAAVMRRLTEYADKNFQAGARYRVRLVMDERGAISVEHVLLDVTQGASPVRVALADMPVDKSDVLLYHKTTSRGIYERAKLSRSDVDDVLLFNADGLITESTIANVVVKIGGRLITPDVSAGLLCGVFRQELIESGQIEVGNVPIESLKNCEEIWLINSVRKWRRAVMV